MTNWKIYARASAVKLSTKIVEIIWGKWKWWFNDTDETAEVSVFYGEDSVQIQKSIGRSSWNCINQEEFLWISEHFICWRVVNNSCEYNINWVHFGNPFLKLDQDVPQRVWMSFLFVVSLDFKLIQILLFRVLEKLGHLTLEVHFHVSAKTD